MNKIKMGIIGIGNMGKNHVRLIKEHSNLVEFVGVFDPDVERVKMMGLEDKSFISEETLMDASDAIIVAAPSSLHKRIALLAAKKKNHLLLEKPLALSYEDGRDIVEAYKDINKVLMVGHVERFNPVITELEKIVKNEEIISIEIDRCSPMDRRISDTDVIYDLMIHDVDILVNALVTKNVKTVKALGTKSYSEKYKDYVQALFEFENGVIGSVTSSRTTEGKIRNIRVHCKNSYIEADLLHKVLKVSRKTRYSLDVGYAPAYRQENIIEEVFVPNIEPLKAEQLHFIECIHNASESMTSGEKSLNAIELLDKVKKEVYI